MEDKVPDDVPLVELEPRIFFSLAEKLKTQSDDQLIAYSRRKFNVAKVTGVLTVVAGGAGVYALIKGVDSIDTHQETSDTEIVMNLYAGIVLSWATFKSLKNTVTCLYQGLTARSVLANKGHS